jgi:prepilin-type N-terminal cleavage/methylation domain-containing protein
MRTTGKSPQAGFTLLESIVTLVILTVFASGLLTWLNSSVSGYQKLTLSQERLAVFNNAVNIIASVNPLLVPVGRVDLSPYSIEWQASQDGPVRAASTMRTGSYYDVALFQMNVTVDKSGKLLGSFVVTQVGYKQTIFPEY